MAAGRGSVAGRAWGCVAAWAWGLTACGGGGGAGDAATDVDAVVDVAPDTDAADDAGGREPDWVVELDPGTSMGTLGPALLGHYDLSGALYDFDGVAGLAAAMRAIGFAEWRVSVGRWEAASLMFPTTTDGAPCAVPLPALGVPAGWTDADLLAARDWFAYAADDPVAELADTVEPSRYSLGYLEDVLVTAEALGATPFVSIDHMPRALSAGDAPLRTDCFWSFMNGVSNAAPRDPLVFASAVRELVRAVTEGDGPAVSHWEIWNEPEFPFFWDRRYEPGGGLDRYFEMAIHVLVLLDEYRAAASADSARAAALRFGLGSFATSDVAAAMIGAFDAAPLGPGEHVPVDFVSFHAYSNDPLAIVAAVEAVATAVEASTHYRDVELVLGEWGPDLEDSAQDEAYAASMEPALLVTTVLALGATAGLDRAHHTVFWDYLPDGLMTWGLVDHDVAPKPLYRAYELLHALIGAGATRLGVVRAPDGRLGGDEGAVLAARGGDGVERVLFVNRASEARRAALVRAGSSATVRALRVFADPTSSPVAMTGGGSVVELPALSIALVELEGD